MDNTALVLARLQFGLTLTYHFTFVALTLGLSILLVLMETQYVRSGNPDYKIAAKFWGKFFLINYAVAIVTGLVNEFQFGMNWSEYARFVGSTFGPPLAFEAMTAFFIESVAIGIWVYGWDKVSKWTHLAAIWLVAVSANYSAFWILSANSFMQNPVGFVFRNGRLELASLEAVIMNSYLFYQFSHTVLSGLALAGFFLLAISSFYLLRREHGKLSRYSFRIGLFTALIASTLLIGTGHFYNQYLFEAQPMKVAATEALWETASPAPLVLVALVNEDEQENSFEIILPAGLSLLAHNSLHAEIKGMRELQSEQVSTHGPGQYIPPVTLLFWSFRVMVGIGIWMAMLLAIVWRDWRINKIESNPALLRALIWTLPLTYIAITAGWIVAEVGRQPWVVYGILLTKKGVSNTVPTVYIWASIISYSAVYTGIAVVALQLAQRVLVTGPNK